MARRRRPSRWTCPLCGRSVPADVESCYCGTSRAAVEAEARREQEERRRERSVPWLTVLCILAAAGLVSYGTFARTAAPPRAPTAQPSAFERTPAAPAIADRGPAFEPPAAEVVPATPLPYAPAGGRGVSLAPVPQPTASPSPAPSPTPERDEVALAREQAERRLDETYARLSREMSRLTANATEFESVCLGLRGEPRSCRRLFDEISSGADALGRGLEDAEEDARRSWVPPGVVRDLRRDHGLEEQDWNDLVGTVRRLKAQYQGGS